eukprot:TRINITY_DN8100_c0_g1_i1.p1 TRINITY_DN8100_c0_g1~~TRINITY_DN8100_c0_g1_i1.p1  ORF type:complete len:385 (+),score=96.32 TRINITY_DN8100_c0_g1_i1:67-1221(+)
MAQRPFLSHGSGSIMFERPHHLGLRWATQWCGAPSYPYVVMASALAFWALVALIPVYNKHYFRKDLFPYPVATAAIQLGAVTALLFAYSVADRVFRGGGTNESWVLGPHLLWKLKWTAPIGVLFGLKYGVSNLGLALLPAPTHLLLQSTDLVWTLLGAWFINGERVTVAGLCSLIGCIAGSTLLAWQALDNDAVSAPVYAIIVNLTSPVLLGLCLTFLRVACTHLMNPNNRVKGTVTSFELTALKLMQSSAVAAVLATYLEAGCWQAFLDAKVEAQRGVVFGAVPIMLYQVNCTFFAFLTSAVGIGILGQVKIVPQWLLATFLQHAAPSSVSMVAAGLTILSAALYAYSNWADYRHEAARYRRRHEGRPLASTDVEAYGTGTQK